MDTLTLSVKNLNFYYDKEIVLKNINFHYSTDDFLAIIGPNGGGKSTLLKLLTGILKSNSGEILINNKTISTCKNYFAYVPQDTSINKDFPIDVVDVVLMGRLSGNKIGFYSKKDKNIALEALEKVSMQNFAKKKIGDISGGQRQRVFIARALACDAKILLLDEPTANVDIKGQVQIYNLLKDINQTKGIIIVSHDVNVSLAYATKIAYVNKTLFMHEINSSTKNIFLQSLEDNLHICPVDMLTSSLFINKFKTE